MSDLTVLILCSRFPNIDWISLIFEFVYVHKDTFQFIAFTQLSVIMEDLTDLCCETARGSEMMNVASCPSIGSSSFL